MLIISPAKKLDVSFFSTLNFPHQITIDALLTSPHFIETAQSLIEYLHRYSKTELAQMMGISEALSALNHRRYLEWATKAHLPENLLKLDVKLSAPAAYLFHGDVYRGLDIASLQDPTHLRFLKNNLYILSGLYGILNAFDLIQAHRLEMGTTLLHPLPSCPNSLKVPTHNLYSFWSEKVTNYILNQKPKVIVNLASNEYAKVVDWQKIFSHSIPVITPVFKDFKKDKYKIINFFAKKARGMMCAFLTKANSQSISTIKKFDLAGYHFAEEYQNDHHKELVFLRKI